MGGYYDRNGIPMDEGDWAAAQAGPYHVGRSKVLDAADPSKSIDVSTIWMGIDHRHGDGPPLIFETMVFAEGSDSETYADRYSTEQQAREGHTLAVLAVAAEMTDPIVMDEEVE